jgi:hypothetical protein
MFKQLLTRIVRPASPQATALRRRLKGYPPYQRPHGGWAAQLSSAQAQENLAHFQAALPQRLQAISALLHDDGGPDPQPALANPAALGPALADALADWARPRWPGVLAGAQVSMTQWLAGPPPDSLAAFSMAFDVALLLGEVVRRGNPEWRWDVDDAPADVKANLPHARRVVLLVDPIAHSQVPHVMDIESIVARCLVVGSVDGPPGELAHPWRVAVDEGLSGAALTFWKAQAAATGGPGRR